MIDQRDGGGQAPGALSPTLLLTKNTGTDRIPDAANPTAVAREVALDPSLADASHVRIARYWDRVGGKNRECNMIGKQQSGVRRNKAIHGAYALFVRQERIMRLQKSTIGSVEVI